jgi:hypothetical protein
VFGEGTILKKLIGFTSDGFMLIKPDVHCAAYRIQNYK